MTIFDRTGHDCQVRGIAARLKVTADDEKINAVPAADLAGLGDGRIDGVESAVALRDG